ncbi:MAG: hypothetical protein EBT20_05075 [Alphaproteobacteria bacterium]|nr:hypothetical protein [Alphaproteobacteria bacterium]
MFEQLIAAQHADPRILPLGRGLTTKLIVGMSQDEWLVSIHDGIIIDVSKGPFVMASAHFSIMADEEAWIEFMQPIPKPGYHDLMALLRRKRLQVHGNLQPFMTHLLYFKLLLACLRMSPDEAANI